MTSNTLDSLTAMRSIWKKLWDTYCKVFIWCFHFKNKVFCVVTFACIVDDKILIIDQTNLVLLCWNSRYRYVSRGNFKCSLKFGNNLGFYEKFKFCLGFWDSEYRKSIYAWEVQDVCATKVEKLIILWENGTWSCIFLLKSIAKSWITTWK